MHRVQRARSTASRRRATNRTHEPEQRAHTNVWIEPFGAIGRSSTLAVVFLAQCGQVVVVTVDTAVMMLAVEDGAVGP